MPFRRDPFLDRFEPLRQLRRKPWVGFVAAVAGVAFATSMRLSMTGSPAPFIMFYPFVILAALIGGWRAGVLSVVLSALAAGYFIIPPQFSLALAPADVGTLMIFAGVCLTLVGLIALLNLAIDRLADESEKVRMVLDAEPAGVICVDENGLIVLVNEMAQAQFGYSRAELLGESVEMLVPEDKRGGHLGWRKAFLAHPEARAMGMGRDLNGRRKDGSSLPIEIGLNPIEHDGKHGALATVIDISERKAAERRQQILTNEVRHRGRNLMAVVQALAGRILTGERDLQEARRDLMGALQALARAQDLFLDTGAASLRSIIDLELAPFSAQVELSDCDIQLTARAAQDFALIVHELTTNALKYGSLSRPDGRVEISCALDNEHFTLRWQEHGGPQVRPPERIGFGHTILKDAAASFGAPQLSFDEAGFRYELKADLARITSNVVELPQKTASKP